MEKKLLIYSLFIIIGVFPSCDDYFLEEFDTDQFDDIEKTLVVNAYIQQHRKVLYLQLFETTEPGKNPFNSLKEGEISVYQNNVLLLETEIKRIDFSDDYGTIKYIPELNDTGLIRLEVKHPDYLTTWAEIQMLPIPQIKNFKREFAANQHDFFGDLDALEFDFIPSNPGSSLQTLWPRYSSQPFLFATIYSEVLEPLLWVSSPSFYSPEFKFIGFTFSFNHTFISNGAIKFNFYSNLGLFSSAKPQPNDNVWFYVETFDFNLANYKFQTSEQSDALRNPFLTPKEINGNWSNSFGYFGIMRVDSLLY
ncbi:MAG: hypothetical protein ACI8ZO_001450 [Flavobacteriales bacterium]|jgi:hypothetical protein